MQIQYLPGEPRDQCANIAPWRRRNSGKHSRRALMLAAAGAAPVSLAWALTSTFRDSEREHEVDWILRINAGPVERLALFAGDLLMAIERHKDRRLVAALDRLAAHALRRGDDYGRSIAHYVRRGFVVLGLEREAAEFARKLEGMSRSDG